MLGTIRSGNHFWNYSCYKPGNGRKYTDCRKCIYLYQDVIDFKGDYKEYATGTDERVQDHGITISMTEAYCDGANLFISYVIESQKKFTEYSDNQIFQNQIGYEGITKIKSDDKI